LLSTLITAILVPAVDLAARVAMMFIARRMLAEVASVRVEEVALRLTVREGLEAVGTVVERGVIRAGQAVARVLAMSRRSDDTKVLTSGLLRQVGDLRVDGDLPMDIPCACRPANLNRDDAGSPKHATYGGVRRSRVSSKRGNAQPGSRH
jgi:hypothetical protein